MDPGKWPIQKFAKKIPDLQSIGEMVNALLTIDDAKLSRETRQAIADEAAVLAGGVRENVGEVPAGLKKNTKKCALYAYRVLDKEYDQMKADGFNEDEIFEASLCAITGASIARLEQGLELLEEGGSE